MRFTIQLNSRPYKALDMASRTSAALSTVLVRMMVSPLVTTHWEVRASWSSSEPMLRRVAAGEKHKMQMRLNLESLVWGFPCVVKAQTARVGKALGLRSSRAKTGSVLVFQLTVLQGLRVGYLALVRLVLGCDGRKFNISRIQNGRQNLVDRGDLLEKSRKELCPVSRRAASKVLRYLFSEADNSEAVLNGVELLRVELAGDDVLHHPAVPAVDVPAGDTSG